MSQFTDRVSKLSGSFKAASGSDWWQQARIYFLVVFTVLVAGIISPNFLTGNNLSNVLRQSAALGIVTVGQTLVMIAGGFDLSVAAIMQLVTVMIAELTRGRNELVLPAFAACMLGGIIIGLVNGALTARHRSAAFMVTLAMSLVVTGARLWYTGGTPSGTLPDGLRPLSQGQILGIPFSHPASGIADDHVDHFTADPFWPQIIRIRSQPGSCALSRCKRLPCMDHYLYDFWRIGGSGRIGVSRVYWLCRPVSRWRLRART